MEFSAGQAAGRLESKRRMKNAAFAKLYEMMFRHLLAYARQPVPYTAKTPDGQVRYAHLDPSATLAANREVLWNMIDLKYQAGAFGPVNDPRSQLRLWTLLAAAEYPHAARMRDSFEEQARRQEQTEQGGEAE